MECIPMRYLTQDMILGDLLKSEYDPSKTGASRHGFKQMDGNGLVILERLIHSASASVASTFHPAIKELTNSVITST